jgi:hypothetical protein
MKDMLQIEKLTEEMGNTLEQATGIPLEEILQIIVEDKSKGEALLKYMEVYAVEIQKLYEAFYGAK